VTLVPARPADGDAGSDGVAGAAPARSVYRPGRPLALGVTLAPLPLGPGDPTVRREGRAWWLAFATPVGPATLHLAATAEGIAGTAWGAGAEHAIEGMPRLLGADDDEAGFDPRRHPVVAELHHRLPGLRLARTGRLLPHLVLTILGQKVTSLEAMRAWRTLVRRYGTAAPGPAPEGMRVAPAAATWRRIPSWEWHRAGVTPQRADTVMRTVAVGDALERTTALPAAEAVRRMRTIPGIGVWTAHETVQRSHGDPDSVSIGDLHLCKQVGMALAGRRVDDDVMLELLEPWRGHRHRVVRYLEASGVGYERRGPRMAIPEHRTR
jgi:3-methyladenine DNA glycosylase/8-oxoguanine DNA glycosylase